MVEIRWVWHSMKSGPPPMGSICVDSHSRLFQKLQYRVIVPEFETADSKTALLEWTEWADVPHSGEVTP
jgi:hypothetical protein